MAYGAGAESDRQTTSRAVSYGYGLDDIQRARESTERQSALGKFQLTKKFQDMARSMPGRFNQRGMIDSGLRKRAQERMAGQRLLEQYGLDYVVTARAKGVSERRITFVHVLRNAMLPVVTMAGVQVGALIGGSVIVESVFAWPGLGMLAFESLFARDLNLLLGIFLLSSALVVAVNLIVDVIYCFLDPRIEVN